jgi:protein disulfide-isomerase A6
MLIQQILALTLALAPSLASAAIFPKDSRVKMLDAKGFKKVMKRNETSVVAFVAPWCGHCQRMVPEYSKAALGLYPLVPLYAVDCDADANKQLCSEQGVKGFPTIKLFPRGNQKPAVPFDSPTRTANAFFSWASKLVPDNVKKLSQTDEISDWVNQKSSKPRALLLNKDKKVPLLWQVLSNKYGKDIEFGSFFDSKRKASMFLGFEAGEKKSSKVIVYPAGSKIPVMYEGLNKYDSLSKYFKSILDGTADIKVTDEATKAEDEKPREQKQESQHGTDNQPPQKETESEEIKSAPEVTTPLTDGKAGQVVFQAAASPSAEPVEELKTEGTEHLKDEL